MALVVDAYIYIYIYSNIVIVCSAISDNELYRQVGMGSIVISGSLVGVIVDTLAHNTRDLGSIPALGTIFLIFSIPMILMP